MISSSTGNYVGSTTRKVDERFMGHIYDLKYDDIGVSSKIVLDGENVSVRTLEEVEYLTDDDELLRQEEQKWIDVTDCVNICRAYTPDDWAYEEAQQTAKEWRKNNKTIVNQNKKIYRARHKEEIKEKMKERYDATKEHRLQQGKKYYDENKQKVIEYQRNRHEALREYKKQIIKCNKCELELARHSLYLHNKRFHN